MTKSAPQNNPASLTPRTVVEELSVIGIAERTEVIDMIAKSEGETNRIERCRVIVQTR